ncbi:hypothetical protein [Cupriavidus basilensis]|uniref:hypothetical protein n=1 Tax=Cupriavidus basilensis TaxID=68895 RepID=UPI0020A6D28C|nr:hypothetical protein [Cupriavidus basilensis]MCP3018012.1 hypothetical protein [Cupriavidus basilensis]
MRERPILFSGAMVRAILDGRKTQTRRALTRQPEADREIITGPYHPTVIARNGEEMPGEPTFGAFTHDGDWAIKCPYGQPGNRLYVRETWAQPTTLDPGPTFYRADYPDNVLGKYENLPPAEAITWKPSIHMPRALSRILLEITGVRVERLNDCSEADALAEGVSPDRTGGHFIDTSDCRCASAVGAPAVDAFQTLWDSINDAGAWAANPWVWVVEFRRIEP